MQFSSGDILLIVLYFGLSLGMGLMLSRRGGASLSEYFLSGRSAPWWLVGTGMVATTFAADTPLAVTGLVRGGGISANWIWWSAAIGAALTVFFFARLWRRAGVLTDLEFIELRYSGPLAAFLRGFKAIYFGLFLNIVVMAWVNLAMYKIAAVLFPEIDPRLAVSAAAAATLLYVALTGLWGVAIADAFQFAVAMGGCIALAWFAAGHPAVQQAGGLGAALPEAMLQLLPRFESGGGAGSIASSAFLAYVLVQWWASWYPGQEPGGGGYIAQRIMSARDERHGVKAALWFLIAHYCVRSWPWILAALAAIVIYPGLDAAHGEESYVYLIRDILGSPWRGLLAAAFLGAYMSTIATHLNWGASYVVNDFLRRFWMRKQQEQGGIRAARVVSLLLLVLSLLLSFTVLKSVQGAWEFLLSCTAGMGFVLILRWYWWRINALAEIVAMVAPLWIVSAMKLAASLGVEVPASPQNLFWIAPAVVVCTLAAVYLAGPESPQTLQRFYQRVRPPGPGWLAISGDPQRSSWRVLAPDFAGWLSAVLMIYGLLFALGAALFGRYAEAVGWGALALAASAIVAWMLRRQFRRSE
ncbi:MAG: Na+:solute symporter [Leptospirales bacterium]|nr:Na+:solute symporter [Leptospirales bacterium]